MILHLSSQVTRFVLFVTRFDALTYEVNDDHGIVIRQCGWIRVASARGLGGKDRAQSDIHVSSEAFIKIEYNDSGAQRTKMKRE